MISPAYLAGIIDGEGSVYSRRRNPHRKARERMSTIGWPAPIEGVAS